MTRGVNVTFTWQQWSALCLALNTQPEASADTIVSKAAHLRRAHETLVNEKIKSTLRAEGLHV